MLFRLDWWKYAGIRAGRTALAMMLPFMYTVAADGQWIPALLAGAFGAITSLASSLRGLRELTGENLPKWKAILHRCAWSLGQGVLTGFGTAAVLSDVDWTIVYQTASSGVLTALVLGVLSALPETEEVVTPKPDTSLRVLPKDSAVVPEGTDVYSTEHHPDSVNPG